jgi:hypothetical protein
LAQTTLCAWPRGSIGQQRFGNAGYIDSDSLYLLMTFARLPGLSLRLRGRFPNARFMSITAYAGRSGSLIDHLADKDIVPDRGSANPFLPYANRNATRRSYTLYIVQGNPPASGRAKNTLYTGPYHPVTLIYRVYAPDASADPYGNVGKPQVEYISNLPGTKGQTRVIPACSPLAAVRGSRSAIIDTTMQWRRFGATGNGAVNADEMYLQMRLNRDDHQVYVLRFKAPTFADTYDGVRITGHEQTRFWSICQYDLQSTRVIACLHDYQAVRSRAGYVTVVLSTLANRPQSATRANGVNWLPFGPEPAGMVFYRQLLPNPSFEGSIANVAPDALQFEIKRALGRYLQTVQGCATAAY